MIIKCEIYNNRLELYFNDKGTKLINVKGTPKALERYRNITRRVFDPIITSTREMTLDSDFNTAYLLINYLSKSGRAKFISASPFKLTTKKGVIY